MKYLAPLVLLLALAGCGSSSAPSTDSGADPGTSPSPTSSDQALPNVQPCDGLDAAAIAKVLGSGLTVNKGTASNPRCALLPQHKGDPVFDLNYQWWFSGGLDAALTKKSVGPGRISSVDIAGAHSAKLVQQATTKQFFISGFVENGNLVQSVNGEALAPYSKRRMVAATKLILTQLSRSAPSPQG